MQGKCMFSGKTREGSTLLRDHNSGRNIHGALHRKVCWWLQKREKKEFRTILMRQVGSFTLTPTGDTDRCRVLCEKITLAREKVVVELLSRGSCSADNTSHHPPDIIPEGEHEIGCSLTHSKKRNGEENSPHLFVPRL